VTYLTNIYSVQMNWCSLFLLIIPLHLLGTWSVQFGWVELCSMVKTMFWTVELRFVHILVVVKCFDKKKYIEDPLKVHNINFIFINFYSSNAYDSFVNLKIVYNVKLTTFEVETARTKTMAFQTQLFWLTTQGSNNDDYNHTTYNCVKNRI